MSTLRYTATAKTLHWLIALIVIGLFALGIYMADLPLSPQKLKLYSYHKWAGITVLLLAFIRLAWRLTHMPPPLPATQPRWQQLAAHAAHWLIYAFIFAAPLSGWIMSSAHGFTTVWFGVLPLPNLVSANEELAEGLKLLHRFLNYSFLALIVVHVLAALKHQWIDRDGTLSRMLPGRAG